MVVLVKIWFMKSLVEIERREDRELEVHASEKGLPGSYLSGIRSFSLLFYML